MLVFIPLRAVFSGRTLRARSVVNIWSMQIFHLSLRLICFLCLPISLCTIWAQKANHLDFCPEVFVFDRMLHQPRAWYTLVLHSIMNELKYLFFRGHSTGPLPLQLNCALLKRNIFWIKSSLNQWISFFIANCG